SGSGSTADHENSRAAAALQGSGLGTAGVLRGTVHDCWRSGKCRHCGAIAGPGESLELAALECVHDSGCAVGQPGQQRARSYAAQIAGSRLSQSSSRVADAGDGEHIGRQSHDYWVGGEHHRRGNGERRSPHRIYGLLSNWFARHRDDAGGWGFVAGLGAVTEPVLKAGFTFFRSLSSTWCRFTIRVQSASLALSSSCFVYGWRRFQRSGGLAKVSPPAAPASTDLASGEPTYRLSFRHAHHDSFLRSDALSGLIKKCHLSTLAGTATSKKPTIISL